MRPPPADETDLPPDEIAAAAVDMERILEQEPHLSDFGFGLADFYKTREEAVTKFHEDRKRISDSDSLAQFVVARGWLRRFSKLKSVNRRGSSYGLKHVAEHDIGYVTNGVFIAAAIAEGFSVRRIESSPNAWFNISSAAWEQQRSRR
jgi:hypothetical protein